MTDDFAMSCAAGRPDVRKLRDPDSGAHVIDVPDPARRRQVLAWHLRRLTDTDVDRRPDHYAVAVRAIRSALELLDGKP